MYKFSLYLSVLFFSGVAYSSSNVWLTNNTLSPLYISSVLLTNDDTFLNEKGLMWDAQQDKLNPFETKKVAWFSRNQHLQKNTLYRYLVCVSPHKSDKNCMLENNDNILYQFDVVGNLVYGSTIRTFVQSPEHDKREVLVKDGLENWHDTFWQDNYQLYGRSWLYSGEVFSSYHFLIDNVKQQKMSDGNANAISILTYNTQLMPFYTGVVNRLNHPDYRAKIIPTYITQYDVVVLQELFDKSHRETLTDIMSTHYPYHTRVVGGNDANVLSGGVMIFSRYPIEAEDSIVYRNCAGDDCLANKGAVYARVLKKNKLYHIVGTHLQAWNNDKARDARKNQLLQLTQFIQQKNIPTEQPLLMAGDFNFHEGSKEFTDALSSLNAMLPVNMGHQYSVDSTVNAMVTSKEQSRLDYVFVELAHQQPRSISSKVIILRDLAHATLWPSFNTLDDAFHFSTLDLSDHFPVVMEAVYDNEARRK